MAFVRTKAIKGNHYAYLVENNWNGKSSRQRVSQYLGRVLEFPIKQSAPAPDMDRDYKGCINEILAWHLIRMGFKRKGDLLSKGRLSFDLKSNEFDNNGKKAACVIKSADGYFCKQTAEVLRSFSPAGSDEEAGLSLAKAVVNAGIELPNELFVALFEKATLPRQKSKRLAKELTDGQATITY